jgi:hypothetical protein
VGKRVHSTVGKCYYGDSRVGERIVTIDTVQMGPWVLPWRQNNGGEGFYHGDVLFLRGLRWGWG